MMKRFIFWAGLCCIAMANQAIAQDDSIGVIVLVDGRSIPIDGQVELLGDEIQFTKDGQIMVLPLEKVDLEATEQRNRELLDRPQTSSDRSGNTLADQVENWKRSGGEVIAPEIIIQKQELKQEPKSPEEKIQNFVEQLQQDLKNGNADGLKELSNSFSKTVGMVLLVVIIVAMLAGIIAFFTQIYVVITSFGYSSGMGWGLVLCWLGSTILSIVGAVIQNAMLNLLGVVLGLCFPILMLIHIIKDRYGSRLKLLTLIYFIPLVSSMMLGGIIIYLAFQVTA